MVPVRKQGKLPGKTVSCSYKLEYGEATLEMHCDAVPPGARVLDLYTYHGGFAVQAA